MTTRLRILGVCGICVLSGSGLRAQGLPNSNGPIVGQPYAVIGAESPRPGLIYGEPYSATTESEISRTLADGTHIQQKRAPEQKMFRDSQGRTRRETYRSTTMTGNDPAILQEIWINDPIAGVEYYLSPQSHIACEGHLAGFTNQFGTGQCIFRSPSSESPRPVAGRMPLPAMPSTSQRPRNNIVVEDLGAQQMEGLTVQGTRTTMTIPAGAQGNDRPIETVNERWFSKELNISVLIKASDPRSGESTIRTTNIERSEPDPSLFQVPPDYTIVRQ